MKRYIMILSAGWFVGCDATEPVSVRVTAQQQAPLSILVIGLGCARTEAQQMLTRLKDDFSFTKQFAVTTAVHHGNVTPALLSSAAAQGHKLVLFLSPTDTHTEWRLYDPYLPQQMIAGKKIEHQSHTSNARAHAVADSVWPALTSKPGFFSTRLAYCKNVVSSKGKMRSYVCVADYDGAYEQIIVDKPTVHIAPRWNSDKTNPLLFYSEYTDANVRLMVTDLSKRSRVSSNFEGMNMLPTFCEDGTKAVYCASRGDGKCHLYICSKNQFKQLTSNEGNYLSPTLSADGHTLFFCSDVDTGKPQIYRYDLQTAHMQRLTEGGYCASPAYCGEKNLLAYTKMVQGTMQLFVYDLQSKQHRQITTDAGNKDECSWSVCGNYIVFAHEKGAASRIGMLNLLTSQRVYVTPPTAHCTYPHWSPRYQAYPEVA